MPTCRRKRVVLTQPSESLLKALKTSPDKDVFYLEKTGEIFETYEYVVVPLCLWSHNSSFLGLMPRECPFIASNSSNVKLPAKVVSITFKR